MESKTEINKLKKTVLETICPKGTQIEYKGAPETSAGESIVFMVGEKVSIQILRDTICFNIISHKLAEKFDEEGLKEQIKKMKESILKYYIRS